MSHVVIRGIPFATRLRAAQGGAKELLERDRARAKKFLAGKSHHAPSATVGEYSRRHHHKGTTTSPPTTVPSGTGGSSTGANSSIDVTDSGVTYTMQVGVGNPATQYTLLIDTGEWNTGDVNLLGTYLYVVNFTGSSNTWVGANLPYKPTSSSHNTGNTIVS
jgi:hypothetical protein